MTTATAKRPTIAAESMHIITVYMADTEWSTQTVEGLPLMDFIALATLREYRDDAHRLVVEVIEHAGWYLQFAIHDGQLITVGSANEGARYSELAIAWHKAHRTKDWHVLPSVRRADLPAIETDPYPYL